jgi:hypothetical protein
VGHGRIPVAAARIVGFVISGHWVSLGALNPNFYSIE